jgi:hypothetical protein
MRCVRATGDSSDVDATEGTRDGCGRAVADRAMFRSGELRSIRERREAEARRDLRRRERGAPAGAVGRLELSVDGHRERKERKAPGATREVVAAARPPDLRGVDARDARQRDLRDAIGIAIGIGVAEAQAARRRRLPAGIARTAFIRGRGRQRRDERSRLPESTDGRSAGSCRRMRRRSRSRPPGSRDRSMSARARSPSRRRDRPVRSVGTRADSQVKPAGGHAVRP